MMPLIGCQDGNILNLAARLAIQMQQQNFKSTYTWYNGGGKQRHPENEREIMFLYVFRYIVVKLPSFVT